MTIWYWKYEKYDFLYLKKHKNLIWRTLKSKCSFEKHGILKWKTWRKWQTFTNMNVFLWATTVSVLLCLYHICTKHDETPQLISRRPRQFPVYTRGYKWYPQSQPPFSLPWRAGGGGGYTPSPPPPPVWPREEEQWQGEDSRQSPGVINDGTPVRG